MAFITRSCFAKARSPLFTIICPKRCLSSSVKNTKNMSIVSVSSKRFIEQAENLPPSLTDNKSKGEAGRIGVFGGSVEFTGAPYFSAITALRVGADLSYVFTVKDAATVIKSYSPELMVLPFLDDADAIAKITPWVDRIQLAVLGPGLGRAEHTEKLFADIVGLCRSKNKPLIIDADGLFFVARNPSVISAYPAPIILTPNRTEFGRICGGEGSAQKSERAREFLTKVSGNVTIFAKDAVDEIISLSVSETIIGGGTGRRCGGQGDMLCGAMAAFLVWVLREHRDPGVACYAASKLTRDCNSLAFEKHGRSMLVTDMIHLIPNVFQETFERKST